MADRGARLFHGGQESRSAAPGSGHRIEADPQAPPPSSRRVVSVAGREQRSVRSTHVGVTPRRDAALPQRVGACVWLSGVIGGRAKARRRAADYPGLGTSDGSLRGGTDSPRWEHGGPASAGLLVLGPRPGGDAMSEREALFLRPAEAAARPSTRRRSPQRALGRRAAFVACCAPRLQVPSGL